ncbi:MAG TPA: putative oxidoreductase C-terminal domain-containing protein [Candidatus Methylomirabilis sp.]|nr:putative oxidoreductase C-terminal domain-containing protein [Candidatus Methylomirabilis sp.]
MHTLAFLEPGHFHAALTLRERHPRARDEIFVYAPAGPELDDFLALIHAFNRRTERPTAWRPVVRTGDDSLERLLAERPGDVAILAGRNDRKMSLMRRLHDAGFHVLADKPWLAGPDGLDDLRHTLAGGPVAMEIMTGRHEITSILTRKLVGASEVFGDFAGGGRDAPAIETASVHHLEKTVNGAPLRRPAWFFDVRVQGDGIADIPTHMVDQAQQLVAAVESRSAGSREKAPELIAARRWATPVPLTLFSRVTGAPAFPSEIREMVAGSDLSYYGNAELRFRLGDVTVALDTRWDLSAPAGGGDTHRTVIRGTRAEIRVELSAQTGFKRRLSIVPRLHADRLRAALDRTVAAWQGDHPGVALASSGDGWQIRVPRELDTGHESHFPLVLADFLSLAERGRAPAALASDTLAKYQLLAQASAEARRVQG